MYLKSFIKTTFQLPMSECGNSMEQKLLHFAQLQEGTCITEGFVKKGSVRIISYSNGVVKGPSVAVDVIYEAMVVDPLPGLVLSCTVEFNTAAGIKARLQDPDNPFILFLAKSHHDHIESFSRYQQGDVITVRVKGRRFQLHDKQISVIAELVLD